jgi:cytochrome P450
MAEEEDMLPKEIVNNAEANIIAGSDTTSHTLTCLVWVLCRDPDVKRMLVEEVAILSNGYADEDV